MRAYLAKHLRRIADDLDPPAKPAMVGKRSRLIGIGDYADLPVTCPASPTTSSAFDKGYACSRCRRWIGPDDVHGCGSRGTWSYTGTVHN